MGVDLGGIVAKQEISLDSLAGKKVVIDGNNALYQFIAIIRQRDGTPLLDSKGRVTSHLSGLFYRTARLVEAKIKPVYVFDGEPPKLKRRTLGERHEIRAEAAEKWAAALKAGDLAAARTAAMGSSRLTQPMIAEARKLLGLMGIPWVQAPQEGEAQAAFMCIRGDVWASASQDFDSLLLGAPRLIRNLTLAGRRKLPGRDDYTEVVPELLELEKVLAELGISREQLIWMAMLAGTDFNEGIRGIGPKKGLKLVKDCRTLAEVVEKAGGADKFEVEPSDVEAIFLNPKTTSSYDLQWGIPEKDALTGFLVDEHDFTMERVEGSARAYVEAMKETAQQSKLGEWFG